MQTGILSSWRRSLILLVAGALLGAVPARAQELVDLELVLAVDVSGSMDPDEQALQRAGYLAAIVHPEVVEAIRSGAYGRIAATYIEWSEVPRVVAQWALIDGPQSAAAFAASIAAAPLGRMRYTSISSALIFAADLFDGNGFEGVRRVIDVSGDGPNNIGPPIVPTRDRILEKGIVINGLPFMLKTGGLGFIPNLDHYYEDCVIGGPGSFQISVRERDQIAEAIRRKLVLEVAGAVPRLIRVAEEATAPRVDCMVGEKRRQQFIDP